MSSTMGAIYGFLTGAVVLFVVMLVYQRGADERERGRLVRRGWVRHGGQVYDVVPRVRELPRMANTPLAPEKELKEPSTPAPHPGGCSFK